MISDVFAAIRQFLQPAVVCQLLTLAAAAAIAFVETLDETTKARWLRTAAVVVFVLGVAATYWAQRDSRELQATLDDVKAGNKSLKTANDTMLAVNTELLQQVTRSSNDLASANSEIRKLYAQQVTMERQQRVLAERFAARTADLAGRVSGDGSFVYLQLNPANLSEVAISAFRSGSYPVRGVTISFDDDTLYNSLRDPSAPFEPAKLYAILDKSRSMFRLGDVGLSANDRVGRFLGMIPVRTNASEQEYSARIIDLQEVYGQDFTLRRKGDRWAVASILTGRRGIIHRCLPSDFPGGVPARWSQFKGAVLTEGCLDGQAPKIKSLTK